MHAVSLIRLQRVRSLVDTMFVGRLAFAAGAGNVALGAVAASSELFTLCLAVSLALSESASSTLARLFAQGRSDEAAAFASRVLQLAIAAGFALAALYAGPSATWCVGLMGAPAGSPMHAEALVYCRVRALALPAAILMAASEGIFRGMGTTAAPLRAATIAAVVNIVLDPLLIFKPFNFGVAGAAAATALAQVTACCTTLLQMRRQLFTPGQGVRTIHKDHATSPQRSGPSTPLATADSANTLLGIVFATITRSSCVMCTWVYVASTIGKELGPAGIAAHGVVLKVWLMVVLAAEAPAVAGQVVTRCCSVFLSELRLPECNPITPRPPNSIWFHLYSVRNLI